MRELVVTQNITVDGVVEAGDADDLPSYGVITAFSREPKGRCRRPLSA